MDFGELLVAYIKPELLILVPILWYIGLKIKDTARIQDPYIPFILMALSVVAALSYVMIFEGFDARGVWIGIIQGVAIACLQGWLFQANKQRIEIKENRG